VREGREEEKNTFIHSLRTTETRTLTELHREEVARIVSLRVRPINALQVTGKGREWVGSGAGPLLSHSFTS